MVYMPEKPDNINQGSCVFCEDVARVRECVLRVCLCMRMCSRMHYVSCYMLGKKMLQQSVS